MLRQLLGVETDSQAMFLRTARPRIRPTVCIALKGTPLFVAEVITQLCTLQTKFNPPDKRGPVLPITVVTKHRMKFLGSMQVDVDDLDDGRQYASERLSTACTGSSADAAGQASGSQRPTRSRGVSAATCHSLRCRSHTAATRRLASSFSAYDTFRNRRPSTTSPGRTPEPAGTGRAAPFQVRAGRSMRAADMIR